MANVCNTISGRITYTLMGMKGFHDSNVKCGERVFHGLVDGFDVDHGVLRHVFSTQLQKWCVRWYCSEKCVQ